jgi:hypothetical protein
MAQRIVVVWQSVGVISSDNTEEVNGLLNEGWSVVSVTPMYGVGPIGPEAGNLVPQLRFAAVVVLQQLATTRLTSTTISPPPRLLEGQRGEGLETLSCFLRWPPSTLQGDGAGG